MSCNAGVARICKSWLAEHGRSHPAGFEPSETDVDLRLLTTYSDRILLCVTAHVLPNYPLWDQGATCGGANVAEFVALFTCPPGRSRSLRAASGRARAGRPSGPRWIDSRRYAATMSRVEPGSDGDSVAARNLRSPHELDAGHGPAACTLSPG
jgi:hypothetical protein